MVITFELVFELLEHSWACVRMHGWSGNAGEETRSEKTDKS